MMNTNKIGVNMNTMEKELSTEGKNMFNLEVIAPQLVIACSLLSSQCDRAKAQDGKGFNKPDSHWGNSIAEIQDIYSTEISDVFEGLQKYRNQLGDLGFDITAVPTPYITESNKPVYLETPTIEYEIIDGVPTFRSNKSVIVDYFNGLLFSNPKYIAKLGKYVTTASMDKQFWSMRDYIGASELKSAGVSLSKHYQTQAWEVALWYTADALVAPTPKKKEVVVEKALVTFDSITLKDESKLLPYQVDHVRHLLTALANNKAVADTSSTGTGKTYSAISVAIESGLRILVLCPKSATHTWKKVATEHFGIELLDALTYAKVKNGSTKYLDRNGEKVTWTLPANTLLVLDEAHKCKNHKTINARILVAAKEQGIPTMILSATLADNPMQMYATGLALGLFKDQKEYFGWAMNHSCSKSSWGGWEFTGGVEEIANIHREIFPAKGHRVSHMDEAVKSFFPEQRILPSLYDMNGNSAKIRKAYATCQKELQALSKRKEKDSDHHLTAILRARQEVELLKVPTLVEEAQNLIEEGNSVVVFCNFIATLEKVASDLKTDMVLHGSVSGKLRAERMASFQADESRIMVVQMGAGGESISLHDLHGNYPRVSLLCPSYSAQQMKQAFGRIYRAKGKTVAIQKVVFAAGTIEESICELVEAKINRIDTLNDGENAVTDNISKAIEDGYVTEWE